MKKGRGFALTLLWALFLIFPFLNAQKVETVNGVRIVHNEKEGAWGKTPKVSIELVKTIGELEAEDENVALYLPSDIVADTRGNIYILDSGNHRIQKYSPDGEYLATFGSKGQGPGELYYPLSLDMDEEGLLCVADPQNQRIQILNPDGTEYRTIRMHKEPAGVTRVLKSGELLVGGGMMLIGPGMDEPETQPDLMRIIDLEGNVVRTFVRPHDFKSALVNRMVNQFHFAPDREGNVYVSFDYRNRIEKYSPEGELLWRADRKLDYSTDPPREKSGMQRRSGGMVTVRMPEMNRCSSGISVDERGRIWVVTLKRQLKKDEKVGTNVGMMRGMDGTRSVSFSVSGNVEKRETDAFCLEVYSGDGVLLRIFPLGHFVDDIRIEKDRLFLLDKMRGAQYFEYRIMEK